ncbi:hypothetical protein PF66_05805 [Pseudomonas asplenii]|uniref:Uncharacterized protein n=1 Tax=Pseudomonas asplenii TaxID=53407 RepID=A0A0M9GCU4_9PSED|nr:hypothetical protein [Pseudomonas fuscovaginae]KPA87847.1 hypothetical protein PF66_05805 [Pseudomonas fuscovaginae]
MPGITLTTHWQKPLTLALDKSQLLALKQYLQDGRESTLRIGAYTFRCMDGYLHFANGGAPGKYYFEMSIDEIVTTIDQAIAADS